MEQVMLDMIPTGAKAVCHVSQYDIGRTIRFNLISGGAAYTLSGTETVKVYIKKPDGTTAERNIANTSSTYVDWVTGEGDCDQAGKCECELVITSGTMVIGSKNFTVKIEEDPYNDQGVVTETAGPAIIATFTTNVVDLLQEVKCSINPIQDLHGEDKPYPAGGGVNIWDEEWELGLYNSSTGEPFASNSYLRSKASNYILVSPNTNYFICSPKIIRIFEYDSNYQFIKYTDRLNNILLVSENCKYIRFCVYDSSYGTTYNNDISINNPSTDHDYHPYENICPINGYSSANITRCGVNLWDEEWELGNINSLGEPVADGYTRIRSKNFIPCTPNTTFYIKEPSNTSNFKPFFYDCNNVFISEGTWVGNNTITTPLNCCYMKFVMAIAYGTTYNNDISINYPATDTTYHAYNGQTYTIAFGQTVYGGVLGVTRGKLRVTHGYYLANGSENFNMGTASNFRYFDMSMVELLNVNVWETNIISNIFTKQGMGFPYCQINGTKRIRFVFSINDTSVTSVDDLKALLTNTNAQIVYPLATPFDIDLTPVQIEALLGVNNVYSDTGDTEVKYLYNA